MPIDPIHQVSFILAGKTEKDQKMPFRLYYLWTKKKLPQIDGDEISQRFLLAKKDGSGVSAEQDVQRECPAERNLEKDNRWNGAPEE